MDEKIPVPSERGRDKKIEEMIENIKKLKQDVSDIKDAIEENQKGQKEIEVLLKRIEENV